MAWTVTRAAGSSILTISSDANLVDFDPAVALSGYLKGLPAKALDVYPSKDTDKVFIRDMTATGGRILKWDFSSLEVVVRPCYGKIYPYIKASEQTVDDPTKLVISVWLDVH